MKKRMNLSEFSNYVNEHKPTKISFCNENQSSDSKPHYIRYQMVFKSIAVFRNPNTICLRSDANNLICIDAVKYVDVICGETVLGDVYRIFCYCAGMPAEQVITLIAL